MTNLAPTAGEVAATKCPITTPAFFFAGKAIFTVSGPKGRFTFKASKPKGPDGAGNKPVFLSVMTGPDNETNYTYAGILNVYGQVITTKASKFSKGSLQVQVAEWAIRQVMHNKPIPAGYAIHHEGKCCRCGRTLTTPESVAAGIGPECAGKV